MNRRARIEFLGRVIAVVAICCLGRTGSLPAAAAPAPVKPGKEGKDAPVYLFEIGAETGRARPLHRFVIVDRGGKVVGQPLEYEELGPLADGKIAFKSTTRDGQGLDVWGYLDASGKVAIEPKFPAYASAFSEGRATVSGRSGLNSLIDDKGNVLIPPYYERIGPFAEGLAWVYGEKMGSTYGYVDPAGKVVIPVSFGKAESFSEGLALAFPGTPVTRPANGLPRGYGYIDKTGRWVIRSQFAFAQSFHEGLAAVGDESAAWYVDKAGKVAFRLPPGLRGESFHSGLARVHDEAGKCGFINKSGKVVIPLRYLVDNLDDFSDGLAAFSVREKDGERWGFIDTTGRTVIPPKYLHPTNSIRRWNSTADLVGRTIFQNFYGTFEWVGGACRVGLPDRRQALIDKTGKVIWQQS